MKEGIICGIISMIGALVGCFAALAVYNIWPEWASIMAGMVAAICDNCGNFLSLIDRLGDFCVGF